jgi:SulP family sulfate permease
LINLDTTGPDALETIHRTLQKSGSQLILCGPNHQPLSLMKRTGFLDRLGAQNCLENLSDAVAHGERLTS